MKGKVKQAAKKVVLACYHAMAHLLPVRRRVVVFMSSLGRNYTKPPCNLRGDGTAETYKDLPLLLYF